MDLSIIIPVYNTDYEILTRCFGSICLPIEITFEVLIVDDGSQSDTGAFCKNYAESHPNWRYIHQENGGVSAARNTGISNATGKYILFLDADDELISQTLRPEYLEGDWDMVFFDFLLCREGHVYTWKLLDKDPENVCKKDFLIASYQNRTNAVWGKLLKRAFLLQAEIRFDVSMIMAEDARFVLSAIQAADKLCYVAAPVYRYAYTHDTGNRRLARFPWKVIENILYYYDYKMTILDSRKTELALTDVEADQLYAFINTQVVKDLFEAIGSLATMNMVFQDMLTMIAQKMTQVHQTYRHSFAWITKTKCFLLRHKWVGIIRLCAYLRLLYLKLR